MAVIVNSNADDGLKNGTIEIRGNNAGHRFRYWVEHYYVPGVKTVGSSAKRAEVLTRLGVPPKVIYNATRESCNIGDRYDMRSQRWEGLVFLIDTYLGECGSLLADMGVDLRKERNNIGIEYVKMRPPKQTADGAIPGKREKKSRFSNGKGDMPGDMPKFGGFF